MGKKGTVLKHIPQRMCVGCRETMAKRTLVRVVRSPDGVRIDPSGKASGRGAYVHTVRSCWAKALDGSLSHALKIEITPADRERLQEYADSLPKDEPAAISSSEMSA